MPVPGADVVIDISHYQNITAAIVNRIQNAGIQAVIHKATEGSGYRDATYHTRKAMFQAKGFLWGSYHCSGGASPVQQVDNYLGFANPAADELICLDCEPSASGQTMTLDQMAELVTLVRQETGRLPVIYCGHVLRKVLQGAAPPILSQCPHWYVRYSQNPAGVPAVWNAWTLWQYTRRQHQPASADGRASAAAIATPMTARPQQPTHAWPLT